MVTKVDTRAFGRRIVTTEKDWIIIKPLSRC